MKHFPRGFLCEGKVSIQFGEKLVVGEIVVAFGTRGFERAAGKISEGVVDAWDVDGGEGG